MNSSENLTSLTNVSVGASSRDIVLVAVEFSIILCLNVAALVGNALVCVAIYRNTSLRTVTNNFILSLALTDLLMAVLVIPLQASTAFANKWIAGNIGLEVFGYCVHILAETSLFTVMLLAVNRYFRVIRPELYRNIYSKENSSIMVATAWLVPAVKTSIGFLVFGIHFEPNLYNPNIVEPMFSSTSGIAFYGTAAGLSSVGVALVVTLCYVKIYQSIRLHNNAAAPSSQEGNSSYGVEEAKITRIMTAILVGFYLCYLSPFVSGILALSNLIGENSYKYFNFYFSFPVFASSAINPIIYATMSRPFRVEFLKILHGNCFS